jgi:ABC-type transport system involved in cytochrome c biogenesis permease subunit
MRARIFALTLVLLLPFTAQAAVDFKYFQNLPIVHEGRVKPLGNFGAILLNALSGHASYNNMSSNEWLARTMFDPAWAEKEKFFLIKNKSVMQALSLSKRENGYYNFNELNEAFIAQKDLLAAIQKEKEPTANERDLSSLFMHVALFEQVKDSMTLLLPLNDKLTDAQKKKIEVLLVSKGKHNQMLRVIPDGKEWFSVWEAFLQKRSEPLLEGWRQLSASYIDNDAGEFSVAAQKLLADTIAVSDDASLAWRLPLENIYKNLHLYFVSCLFYLTALLLLCFAGSKLLSTAKSCLYSGFVLHGLGILLRMLILQRPPVSTLYESLLFVGLVVVAFGLFLSRRTPQGPTLIVAALAGVSLHLVGFGLTDEQDSLKVLQAVLDTRFWLATHVVMITVGYALTLLTSLFAQVTFYQSVKTSRAKLSALTSRLGLWSLAFVATGTILGGIWADQSWGRFWGWDPKENGALLIVLWIIWLLHGKVAKQLTQRGVLIGYALLSIIVAFSWIGTNLLGVGLHSYGFVTGVAGGLTLFVIVQAIVIFYLNKRIGKNVSFEFA